MNKRVLSSGLVLALVAPLAALAIEPGEKIPNCVLTRWNGPGTYELKSFANKVVYLDFCASWCGPCAKSFSFMNHFKQSLQDRGLQIVAVNLDENRDDATEFLGQYPAEFSVASDAGQQCAQAVAVAGMPSSYLVDRQGVVRYKHQGFRSEDAGLLQATVEKLLAE